MFLVIRGLLAFGWSLTVHLVCAQGPPITVDNPIMLGARRVVIQNLTEVRYTDYGTLVRSSWRGSYRPTAHTLVALDAPLVHAARPEGEPRHRLGDVQLVGKYQFYRRDRPARTLRAAFKTVQTLPTGPPLGIEDISMGQYQAYGGAVVGYESLRYGVAGEVGYRYVPQHDSDAAAARVSAGLPLLPARYPVRQLTLYGEANAQWFPVTGHRLLLAGGGIQFALRRFIAEAAGQWPIVQQVSEANNRRFSLWLGFRYVI
ncbi:MAG: hypothetical protein WA958_21180 [Tunicatimonas sp.]